MKTIYSIVLLFLINTVTSFSQTTVDFEGLADELTTFTASTFTFNTNAGFVTQASFLGTGSSNSHVYLDNADSVAFNDVNSISTNDGSNFTVKDLFLFLSEDIATTVGGNGGLIIRGKESGVVQFSVVVQSSDVPTSFAINNGFFNIDFSSFGGSDNSQIDIDEIEFELTGDFNYLAVDEFTFGPEFGGADTSAPIVQSIDVNGTPASTDDTVSFDVSFNEAATNVSTDDFELTFNGTATGAINSISGSNTSYTITVNGISGEGSIRLDLKTNTNIIDALGNGNGTNGNSPAFTTGELHIVSVCFLESFENTSLNDTSFTSNGILFNSSNGCDILDIETIVDAGASNSDYFLSNDGTAAGTYSITSTSQFTLRSMDMYLSSVAAGSAPTNDGTLTLHGKLAGSTIYTISKTTNFPTSLNNGDNGFFNVNFASDGSSDFSTTDIDEIEIIIGGSFVYLAIDHFEFCEEGTTDTFPPNVVSIELVGNPSSLATSLDFSVAFNENVSNVSTDDFTLDATGTIAGTISSITPVSGSEYTVTVNNITGLGTVSIDLLASTNIQDTTGNSGPPAFTGGENFTISECFVETFESFAVASTSISSNGVDYTLTNSLDVFELNGAGVNSSNKYLDNESGGAGSFSIKTTSGLPFKANSIFAYLSSAGPPIAPSADGTLIITGKISNGQVFTATLNSGNTSFPTSTSEGNNGFFQIDFSSLGGSDYSNMLIDELEFEITSAFTYIALDNFEYCQDTNPPTVSISSTELDPTNANPIPISVSFNEPVTGFVSGDVSVSGGTLSTFAGSGANYSFNL
ncbi:MAG: beta strand repeat-containing protein, partial [Wenyingzhuangia sp.]